MSMAEYRKVIKYFEKFHNLPPKSMSHHAPQWMIGDICPLDRVSESCSACVNNSVHINNSALDDNCTFQ